jgi:uncharacterized integral membrane protein (TIGR00697 family)
MNSLLLCLQVATFSGMTLAALRFGKASLTAWLAVLAACMNLFVLKQITLFGLNVTSSDALAVGYLLGLNLIQEFFGRKVARKMVWISFFASGGFILLSQMILAYTPNQFDAGHPHLLFVFSPAPRLMIASLISFLLVQFVDLAFFQFLQTKTQGKYLTLRTTIALILSQLLDTLLFSFLGLYGLVSSLSDVILMSLAIKGIVILLTTPFVAFSRRMARVQV